MAIANIVGGYDHIIALTAHYTFIHSFKLHSEAYSIQNLAQLTPLKLCDIILECLNYRLAFQKVKKKL